MSEISDALNSLIADVLETPAIFEEVLRAADKGQATFIWALTCPEIRKALAERDGQSPGLKEALEVTVAGYIVEFRAREDCARFAEVEPDELGAKRLLRHRLRARSLSAFAAGIVGVAGLSRRA